VSRRLVRISLVEKFIFLHERGLVGKFKSLWMSHRAIHECISEKRVVLGKITMFCSRNGFYLFPHIQKLFNLAVKNGFPKTWM
jgi:hypothetical protein